MRTAISVVCHRLSISSIVPPVCTPFLRLMFVNNCLSLNSYVDLSVMSCRRHVECEAESASRKLSPPLPRPLSFDRVSNRVIFISHGHAYRVLYISRVQYAVASMTSVEAGIVMKAKLTACTQPLLRLCSSLLTTNEQNFERSQRPSLPNIPSITTARRRQDVASPKSELHF